MNISELFESNLALIGRVIATVCRRAGLEGADAEDFASSVHVALMEDDFAIVRKFEGRSSFATYLAVVVQRLLLDERSCARGRWRPSREAERFGDAGVLLETLLLRDHRSLDEALPLVQAVDPAMTRERASAMAGRFRPHTARPRSVELSPDAPIAAFDTADGRVVDAARRRLCEDTNGVLRRELARLPDDDAMILRLRYGSGMSIADISRMLRLPQRPLYRRLESLLARLRAVLQEAGLDGRELVDLIGEADEMDFGLEGRKNEAARPSLVTDGGATEEGR